MAFPSSSSSSALSIPSSSSSQNWEYDVFPSFHGKDVRKAFLSHILKEFERKAINFFVDNEIERGEFIGPELKRAIKGSKIALVLLSKNYASSSWCLDELVEIMKQESGQTVITIFYEVDPTDVKKQTGDFGKAFKETCKGKEKEKIKTWRKDLEDVATIAGYHSSNWVDEAAMIENISVNISKMLIHLTNLSRLVLDRCSSLVELPSSVGNLTNLQELSLEGCSRLVSLPQLPDSLMVLDAENCESLEKLDCSFCNPGSDLIFANCFKLNQEARDLLIQTSTANLVVLPGKEVPACFTYRGYGSSVTVTLNQKPLPTSTKFNACILFGNLTNLSRLVLDRCSSLVELPSSVGNLTNLQELSLEGCSRLVSLPQLPNSLRILNAENCKSLEKLDCSFSNPGTHLNFANCFNLNQEARDLLIQTSIVNVVVLPGKEMPACFTYRECGNSVTVNLYQNPPTSTKFKACILFGKEASCIDWDTTCVYTKKYKGYILLHLGSVSCSITKKLNGFSYRFPIITKHLYIFEVEVEEVTSIYTRNLVFNFEIFDYFRRSWEIKECGVIHILEHHVDGNEKMAEIKECGVIHILEHHVDGDEKMAIKMETIVSEKTNSRVAWYSIMSLGICIVVSLVYRFCT